MIKQNTYHWSKPLLGRAGRAYRLNSMVTTSTAPVCEREGVFGALSWLPGRVWLAH